MSQKTSKKFTQIVLKIKNVDKILLKVLERKTHAVIGYKFVEKIEPPMVEPFLINAIFD